MQKVFTQFGITSEKVVAVVTDNASNFAKTFREFGLGEAYIDLREECEYDEVFNVNLSEYEDDDNLSFQAAELSSRIAKLYNLPPHFRCACHTLNLVATADYKKIIDETFSVDVDTNTEENAHFSLIAKGNKLWKASRRPASSEVLTEILPKSRYK